MSRPVQKVQVSAAEIASLRDNLVITRVPEAEQNKSPTIKTKIAKLDGAERKHKTDDGRLMYASKGGVRDNLNGQARDVNGEEIFCRQLTWFLSSSARGIKDVHHKAFNSVANIKRIKPLDQNDYDKHQIAKKSALYSFIDVAKDLGQELQTIAACLKPYEETTIVLHSENHDMAFTIIHKVDEDNQSQYILKFYDPNLTASHFRVICPSLDSIRTFSLTDRFMDDEWLDDYFPNMKTGVLASTKIREEHQSPTIRLNQNRLDTNYLKSMLHFSMRYNIPDNIDYIFDKLLTEKRYTSEEVEEILIAKDELGYTLNHAITRNNSATVSKYINKLIHSGLETESIKRILLAEGMSGTAFGVALLRASPEVIASYMDPILESAKLDEATKGELLLGATKDGLSALNVALCDEQRSDAVALYCQKIIDSNLSASVKNTLLCGASDNKLPGLMIALMNNKSATVKAYLQTILHSDLTDDNKSQILIDNIREFIPLILVRYHDTPLMMDFVTIIQSNHAVISAFNKALDIQIQKIQQDIKHPPPHAVSMSIKYTEALALLQGSFVSSALSAQLEAEMHAYELEVVEHERNRQTAHNKMLRSYEAYQQARKSGENLGETLRALSDHYHSYVSIDAEYSKKVKDTAVKLESLYGELEGIISNEKDLLSDAENKRSDMHYKGYAVKDVEKNPSQVMLCYMDTYICNEIHRMQTETRAISTPISKKVTADKIRNLKYLRVEISRARLLQSQDQTDLKSIEIWSSLEQVVSEKRNAYGISKPDSLIRLEKFSLKNVALERGGEKQYTFRDLYNMVKSKVSDKATLLEQESFKSITADQIKDKARELEIHYSLVSTSKQKPQV